MIYWIRELLGWTLLAAGLFVFYVAMRALLQDGPYILEGPMMIAIGFVIFRGGLQVLKVSLAGRVCTQAHKTALTQREAPRRAVGTSSRRTAVRG
jgi:hypothetical protein